MSFDKRPDNRKMDEPRKMKAVVGVIPNAVGSAMFEIGDTQALAAVYGPRNLHPRFKQNPLRGILRCHYNMMPFSGAGDRIRPGGGRRSKEISMVMEKSLAPIVNLNAFPNTVVDIFVEFPQTDAGSRCAGITAASMALAHAGIEMKDLVSAVAVGKVGDKIVVDLDKKEEDFEGEGGVTDIPIAVLPHSGHITLLQADGAISREDLKKALELGVKACKEIYKVQKDALKAAYKEE